MNAIKAVKLAVRGLIRLGRLEKEEETGQGGAFLSPLKMPEFAGEETPVYSLRSPAPVWRRESPFRGELAIEEPKYPPLRAERPEGPREELAEAVYRRMDFDARLVPQPMWEE